MPDGLMTLGPLRQDWRVTDWLPELKTQEPGLRVDLLSETGSTNADLMSMARSGQLHPQVRVAEHQTQGRGRLGRVWQSQDGASLTVSVGLLMSPQDWSGLSLVVGTVLAQALEHRADSPRLGLKWPNDLWLREPIEGAAKNGIGRKLGGILIETLPTTADARWCVIGMGLNIAPQVVDGAQTGVACLQELDARWTAPLALQTLMPPLWAALRRFEREGFAPWHEAFTQRDLLRDQAVTTTLRQVPQGRAVGVDGQGGLRVLDAQGQVHSVVGGEVSIRLAPS
jgi:BirA family transcriptional regulator, biotin operon repressor / biotin---[acetyl-CoA-carboxylase] ligase